MLLPHRLPQATGQSAPAARMAHHLLLLLLLLFLPSLSAAVKLRMIIAPSQTVVEDQKVHISCYVDNLTPAEMRGFSLHLYCPVFSISTGIACFQNCTSSCIHSKCPQQRQLSKFACKRYTYGSSLTFEYTLAKAEMRSAGYYRCTFMGKSTETLKMNVLKDKVWLPPPVAPPKPPVAPPKPPVPPKVPAVPPSPPRRVPPVVPDPPKPLPVRPAPPPTRPRAPSDGRGKGTEAPGVVDPSAGRAREKVKALVRTGHSLIFIVILLFLISMLINSIFIIRCVLIWFYGTSRKKVRMGNLLCMNEEINVLRDRKGSPHYSMLALPLGEPSVRPLLMHHPPGIARQHSADQPQMRIPYTQPRQASLPRSRPQSQQSNDSGGPRVMRVISEIELQAHELPEEQTIMYVQVPIMVQRNGSVSALPNGMPQAIPSDVRKVNGHVGGRPQSVYLQSGPVEQVGRRPHRLSTSTSSIDQIRRSGNCPERILSIESVFQMEPLRE